MPLCSSYYLIPYICEKSQLSYCFNELYIVNYAQRRPFFISMVTQLQWDINFLRVQNSKSRMSKLSADVLHVPLLYAEVS